MPNFSNIWKLFTKVKKGTKAKCNAFNNIYDIPQSTISPLRKHHIVRVAFFVSSLFSIEGNEKGKGEGEV